MNKDHLLPINKSFGYNKNLGSKIVKRSFIISKPKNKEITSEKRIKAVFIRIILNKRRNCKDNFIAMLIR